MTEAERASFMKSLASRGPGKRQVRPTAAFAELTISDDENDEDFEADLKGSDESEEEDSEDDDSSAHDEEESEEPEAEDDESNMVKTAASTADDSTETLLCSLCLNLREAVAHEEVIQCDKCGIAVHESCYMADTGEDNNSTHSSSSTEPWFCEPCTFGLTEPPHCEFCPNRYGAFKRSDIGGRWSHLLCALYNSPVGVSFGDVDHLSAVSWQELDYRAFGRKSCMACSNRLEARTGVAVQCDAGMCKNHLHVTCAQKLGLLVDNSEVEEDEGNQGPSKGRGWYAKANVHAVEPRFLTCKRHANEDDMRIKRLAYQRWEAQEERRMVRLHRRAINEREERKRLELRERTLKRLKALEGVTICWPQDRKRGRMLHTSAEYVEAFAEKAEMAGVSREDFEKPFVSVRGETLPFLPPALSSEFVAYYEEREKHAMGAEQRRLEKAESGREAARRRHALLEADFSRLSTEVPEARAETGKRHDEAKTLLALLLHLGVRDICLPGSSEEQAVVKKRGRRPKAETIAARLSAANGLMATPGSGQGSTNSASSAHSPRLLFHTCDTCKKSSEQHKLVQCDSCYLHFHLHCLDPPLEKMPKKTAQYGWQCSHCARSSDSDDGSEHSEELGGTPDEEGGGSGRKLRERSSLAKALKMEEEMEQKRALTAVLRNSRRPVAQMRKRSANSSKTTPKNGFKDMEPEGLEAKRRRAGSDMQPLHIDVNGHATDEDEDFGEMPTLTAEGTRGGRKSSLQSPKGRLISPK